MTGRFVLIVDLTQDDDMSDIPLQVPASARVVSDDSALVAFSQSEGDVVRKVPTLHPVPSQSGVNHWQLQCPSAYPQGSPAGLGPQETTQKVTQLLVGFQKMIEGVWFLDCSSSSVHLGNISALVARRGKFRGPGEPACLGLGRSPRPGESLSSLLRSTSPTDLVGSGRRNAQQGRWRRLRSRA